MYMFEKSNDFNSLDIYVVIIYFTAGLCIIGMKIFLG